MKSLQVKRRVFFLLLFAAGFLLLGAAVMLLWNAILPAVLPHVQALRYGQALGLLLLSRILFGSLHFGGRHGRRPPFAGPALRERFMQMSEEERAAFREQWKEQCKK